MYVCSLLIIIIIQDLIGGDYLLDKPNRIADNQTSFSHLNTAAFNGFLPVVRNCIEVLKQDPFQVSFTGDTTFHIAAQGGHLNVVKYLAEYCTKKEITLAIKNTIGKIPLHIAAQNGHLPIVQYFIEVCDIDPLFPDQKQISPLLEACHNGDIKLVKYLITQAQKHQNIETILISSVAKSGSSALHFAAASGNPSLVEQLIAEYKMSPNIIGHFGATPFLVASHSGQINVLRFLANLESCDIHCTTQETKLNALHFAASKGHLAVIKYLSSVLKLDPFKKDLTGQTAVHTAALYGYIDIVRWFIEDCNVQSDVRDCKGQTPLHNASSQGHLQLVNYFVENCNCPVLLINNKRETPLHVAAQNGHTKIVQYYTLQKNVHPLCPTISYRTPLYT